MSNVPEHRTLTGAAKGDRGPRAAAGGDLKEIAMTDAYVRERAEEVVEKPGETWVAETPLKAGAIGLTGAVMQNITHIAPAIAGFFFTATIVGFSGAHAPLAYLLGFLVVLALGSCLAQLA